jgi:parallel beta-helix repeat protein
LDNLIKGNRAEGLYLLRSSGNRIAGNTIRNHGAAGIYVKDSARNIIEGNVLINDPLQLVYGSQQNVLIDNTIVGQQIRFKEASVLYTNRPHGPSPPKRRRPGRSHPRHAARPRLTSLAIEHIPWLSQKPRRRPTPPL